MDCNLDAYVIFDFETGGFDCTLSPATEIAIQVLHPQSLEEIARYESLIQVDCELVSDKFKPEKDQIPKNPYEGGYYYQGAFNTTGLSIPYLKKNGKKFQDVAKGIVDTFRKGKLIKSHWSKPIPVGHNLKFDLPFLELILRLGGEDMSKLIHGWRDKKNIWHPFYEDTMEMSKMKWPTLGSYKLGNCCEEAGIELIDAHRAMNDVIGTGQLFSTFLNCMRGNEVSEEKKKEKKTRKVFQI